MRRLIAAAAMVAAIVAGAEGISACASAGAPPGGPERHTPPEIVSVSVDSGAINVKVKSVEFKFDEVVSDRPAGGATNLDQVFLISPLNGAAVVSWHRTRVDVRPKNGFKPNTAYRVTMLPGVVDLHGNARKDTRTMLFSTGPTFPPYSVHGQVFDWTAQKVATGAYIEAISQADTNVVYVTAADSMGLFDDGPLPAGTYLVRGLIDANNNRALDRGEKWDTTSVTITTSSPVVELDAIARDSTPPVLDEVRALDSLTLRLVFDKPLNPSIALQPSFVHITRPDSSVVQVDSVIWASVYDRADSVRRADSTRRAAAARPAATAPARPAAVAPPPGERPPPPPPKPSRPAPEHEVIVKLAPATPVLPTQRIYVTVTGFENLVGHTAPVHRVIDVPKPPPPPAPKPPADSTHRVRTDTTSRRVSARGGSR